MAHQEQAPISELFIIQKRRDAKCKNHIVRRFRNPIRSYIFRKPIELIQIYDCRYGDSNDVIEAHNVRGTPSQIDEYAKYYFRKRYWNDLEDMSDDENITYVFYENEDNVLSVDCSPMGNEYQSWRSFIDLIHPNRWVEAPKYIINYSKDKEYLETMKLSENEMKKLTSNNKEID